MTPDMIAILAVGVALAGLMWQMQRSLRADFNARMDRMEARMDLMDGRMDRMEARMDRIEARMDRMDERMDRIETCLAELGERVSRIEGILHLHLGRNEALAPGE